MKYLVYSDTSLIKVDLDKEYDVLEFPSTTDDGKQVTRVQLILEDDLRIKTLKLPKNVEIVGLDNYYNHRVFIYTLDLSQCDNIVVRGTAFDTIHLKKIIMGTKNNKLDKNILSSYGIQFFDTTDDYDIGEHGLYLMSKHNKTLHKSSDRGEFPPDVEIIIEHSFASVKEAVTIYLPDTLKNTVGSLRFGKASSVVIPQNYCMHGDITFNKDVEQPLLVQVLEKSSLAKTLINEYNKEGSLINVVTYERNKAKEESPYNIGKSSLFS